MTAAVCRHCHNPLVLETQAYLALWNKVHMPPERVYYHLECFFELMGKIALKNIANTLNWPEQT